MSPWSPLDWIRSAQDWFSTTERSSGFRPYLIYLILCFGAGLALLTFFSSLIAAQIVAILLISIPAACFIILFGIKAFQDPQFCRSERHVEKVLKLEIESLGSESHQLEAEIVEKSLLDASKPESLQLPAERETEGA
jgi:hypothetical protein